MVNWTSFSACVAAFLAVLVTACGYSKVQEKQKGAVCDQRYALCTSAQCIPDPSNPSKAICTCDVLEGKSYGLSTCDLRRPHRDNYGVEYVISTYSFEQAKTKNVMKCESGNPWTDCLDKVCTVDPMDPSKAICTCDIYHRGEFVTYGGDCDTSTCKSGYWSGATVDQFEYASKVLKEAMGLTDVPTKWCPQK